MRQMVTLFCALLAAAIAPSPSRAAYAEVDRPAAHFATTAADSPPARAPEARSRPARSRSKNFLPQTAPAIFAAPLYVLYCSLLV